MRAIVIEKFGGPDCLVYKDLPEPEPLAGHVVIEVKAFGLNHAELHMRRGEWAEAAPVSGIECVGLVKAAPGGEFPTGAIAGACDLNRRGVSAVLSCPKWSGLVFVRVRCAAMWNLLEMLLH